VSYRPKLSPQFRAWITCSEDEGVWEVMRLVEINDNEAITSSVRENHRFTFCSF
jgi:hypothetical protein